MKNPKIIRLAGLAPAALALTACGTKQQPNIIFFMVDDMGWVDSQVAYGDEVYPFNERYETPNMKALSEAGVIMTNAYACPVSTPTRTSLMSGMNSVHTHITNWTATMKDTPSDATGGAVAMMNPGATVETGGQLTRPEWNINGLSPVEGYEHTQVATPFPKILKDNGYFTIHVGKAHWASAGTPGASPLNMGFTVNVSGNVAGMPRSYQSDDYYGNTPELWNYLAVQNMTEYYGSGLHLTEALTREALKTLDYPIQHKTPFFLYLAHYATHTPIQRDSRFIQKYLDAGMDEGQARYASMVEGVDKSLGDVLSFIKEKGIEKNTIIIFMTDNGGNSENTAKGGIPHTQNTPLREGKGSCYEGGIRVPLIIRWPGKTPENVRVNTPVVIEDLFPTILEMAGVKNYETVQDVDGESLVKLVTKGAELAEKQSFASQKDANGFVIPESVSGLDPLRPILMHYPHQWKPYDLVDIDYLSSIREGDWKLVYRMREQKLELYNLKEDISERNDLSAQNPEMTAHLAELMTEKFTTWNASMPGIKGTDLHVAMPVELLTRN